MSHQNEIAEIEWRGGMVPVSTQFDDPYFSVENGLEETRYVFLKGNNLPDRFCDGFHIGELGFGSGLNLLAVWQAWEASDQRGVLRFTSFEAFPMSLENMRQAHQHWPELNGYSHRFFDAWDNHTGRFETDTFLAEVIFGDARQTLPKWNEMVDAWFLDGFSPAKNPELWGEDLMCEVGKHTNQNGTIATYTAAGHVRQALANAGFEITRVKGFGRKRHMTRGILENG